MSVDIEHGHCLTDSGAILKRHMFSFEMCPSLCEYFSRKEVDMSATPTQRSTKRRLFATLLAGFTLAAGIGIAAPSTPAQAANSHKYVGFFSDQRTCHINMNRVSKKAVQAGYDRLVSHKNCQRSGNFFTGYRYNFSFTAYK